MALERIQGMIPPVVAPLDDRDQISEEQLRAEVRYLVAAGVDGLCSGGSTGEGAALSDRELIRALEILMEEKSNSLPVVAGAIRNSTGDVVRLGREAKALGAEALLVTPVFYYGATLEGNYQFYKEIGKQVGLPIIIYNVVPTNPIDAPALRKLMEIDEVQGIKQIDPVVQAEMKALCGDRVKYYAACDRHLYASYVAGASGAISALTTVAPKLCVEQWQAFKRGDQAKAMELHERMVPIAMSYFGPPLTGKIKKLLKLQGRMVGSPRHPTLEPTADEIKAMEEALRSAGIID